MDKNEENRIFANAFNCMDEIGPVRLNRLIKAYDRLKTAWDNLSLEMLEKAEITGRAAGQVMEKKHKINPDKAYEDMLKNGITSLMPTDEEYPVLLKEIPAHPPLLYVRGQAQSLGYLNLAVVGTRKLTTYGKQVIARLIPDLAAHGINIASGLAFGTDGEALAEALDCGLNPVAVLASSLDDTSISPRTNFHLAQRITKQGCLVSEYALGNQTHKQNFPVRNRIISGLSIGTLVIEADEKSGALITANYSLEQNRHVFAVPGPIFSDCSRGTNNLIKRGARPVTAASDIVEELNLDLHQNISTVNVKAGSEQEQVVLGLLGKQQTQLDSIIRETKLKTSTVITTLTLLELQGRVKNLGNGNYVKIF